MQYHARSILSISDDRLLIGFVHIMVFWLVLVAQIMILNFDFFCPFSDPFFEPEYG